MSEEKSTSQSESKSTTPEKKKNPVTSVFVGALGAVCAFYLINPTLGVFELIPDNIPVFGNLDEAGAAALLISCLSYFGLDLGSLFGRKEESPGEVIDVEATEEK